MILLVLGLVLVAVIQTICLFALVDQYKSLLQVREALRLVDTPQELPLLGLEGVRPSAVGLPPMLDMERIAIVVFLSTKCNTCQAVARGLGGHVPSPGWAVIAAGSESQYMEFKEAVGLGVDRVLIDPGGRIADNLKIRIFPTAVVFGNGAALSMRTIPSYRQLRQLLEGHETLASVAS